MGIGLQTYYSIQHVQAAAYLTRRAARVEANLTGDTAPEAVELKAYVSSARQTQVPSATPYEGKVSGWENTTRT